MPAKKPLKVTPLSNTPTIAEYRAEYAKADRFCQEVQDFVAEAGIPALNELRNAGHHLLKSIEDDGELKNPKELIRAINHAKRACYEAAEAGIIIGLDDVKLFQGDFRNVQISDIVPDYLEMMTQCEEAREAVIEVRTNDEDKSRDYQIRMDTFKTIKETCRKLQVARPELIKRMEFQQGEWQKFVITCLLSGLGIAVTLAIAGIGFYFANK